MTASPEVSTGGDVFSELGSLMNDTSTDVDTGSEDLGTDAPELEAATEDIPGGEEPTAPDTNGQPLPDTPPGEGASEFKLSEDGKFHLVPKEQLGPLNGFKQYASEVQEIFPTANDAKLAAGEASDARAMHADFINGDEKAMESFLQHFAGEDYSNNPAVQKQYQQAFGRMALKVPELLKKVDPDSHSKFVEGVGSQLIEEAYAEVAQAYDYAERTGMPGDKDWADLKLVQAQQREFGLTGQVRGTYDQATGNYKYEIPKVDPQKAEAERIAKERGELDARRDATFNRDFKAFDETEANGPKWAKYWAEIDKTLEPVKAKFGPKQFAAIKAGINTDLIAKLGADFDWKRNHNNEYAAIKSTYKQHWDNNQDARPALQPRIQAYQNDLLQRARKYLPSIAQDYINEATATAVANNRQARAPRAPQQRPTQPAPATNGTTQQQQYRGRVPTNENPEFAAMFGKL